MSANVKAGQTYETPGGDRIWIRRVARDGSWADIQVTQQRGASWSKRQKLESGALTFECHLLSGGAS